jgi:hypothetical protein
MKNTLLLIAVSCLFIACNKGDDPAPANNNNNNNTNTNPYYFKFKLDGTDYNLTSDLAQYMSAYEEDAGGYQMAGPLTYPSVGIRFMYDSTVTDAQIKALAGKTFYFDQKTPSPQVTFSATPSGDEFASIDTANTAYNVKVTSVTYLRKDTTIFNPVAAYVIKGTCSAILLDRTTNKKYALTAGDFNYIISRVNK